MRGKITEKSLFLLLLILFITLSACGSAEETVPVEETVEEVVVDTAVEETTVVVEEVKQPKVYEELPQVAQEEVPAGQGLWAAFWMMPTKDNVYGSWPVCGEIDIMEILGHQTDTTYATIHYGEPHEQQQGTYVLQEGTFSDSFHEFCVEWEPDEMRFYVDDNLYHTVNEWFCEKPYIMAYDYPAPFNQDFYVQLNLAVGGTWPGDPDETTDFDYAEFEVDYVRVYQKPEHVKVY